MTPLDPITARMFPTLARYARRQRRLGLLGFAALLCALSFAGGVVVGAYRGKVADENYQAWGLRLNSLEHLYQEDHPRVTTKVQANDWAWAREKRAQSAALMNQVQKERTP